MGAVVKRRANFFLTAGAPTSMVKNIFFKEQNDMALRLVRGVRRGPEKKQSKSRAEYLVACLRDEANDPKFSDWEREFIVSLARQVGLGRQLSDKQKEILERLWDK